MRLLQSENLNQSTNWVYVEGESYYSSKSGYRFRQHLIEIVKTKTQSKEVFIETLPRQAQLHKNESLSKWLLSSVNSRWEAKNYFLKTKSQPSDIWGVIITNDIELGILEQAITSFQNETFFERSFAELLPLEKLQKCHPVVRDLCLKLDISKFHQQDV